ncbi:MAG TPA: hypothetical protein VL346_09110 [Acidobacteriaceae bacterium]|nr:hypothetical protein [Acidobacteriaceae bacterium]
MSVQWQKELRPGVALHTLVQEATAALIVMDAERLEELARCCADLNGELRANSSFEEATEVTGEIAAETRLLGRILIETRANLAVLSRLHVIHLQEQIDSRRAPGTSVQIADRHFSSGDSYGDN